MGQMLGHFQTAEPCSDNCDAWCITHFWSPINLIRLRRAERSDQRCVPPTAIAVLVNISRLHVPADARNDHAKLFSVSCRNRPSVAQLSRTRRGAESYSWRETDGKKQSDRPR